MGRLTSRAAVLVIVVVGLLAGCQSEAGLFRRAPGSRGEVEAVANTLTAENVEQMMQQERWVVALGAVVASDYSPTQERIATLGSDRIVRIWDASTGRLLDELHEHQNIGSALAYSPDGTQLISGGGAIGQDTRLWDLRQGRELFTTSTDGYYVFDVAWAPDGEQFIVVSRGSSRVYVYSARVYDRVQRRPSGIPATAVTHGDEYMAVTNNIGSTYIYAYRDPGAYVLLHEIRYDVQLDLRYEEDVQGHDLEFSRGDELLANCYENGAVEIWRSEDWEPVAVFKAHEFVKDEVFGCRDGAFSLDGDVYFSVGDDGFLRAWDPRSGEMLAEWQFDVQARTVTLSAAGDQLAVGMADGSLVLFGLPGAESAGG